MVSQSRNYDNPRAEEPIVFIHIPKTAGMSFTHLLERDLPAEDICPAYLWDELLTIPAADLARYRLIRGHFWLDMAAQLLGGRPRFVTFLRDPIERSISHYLQLQHHEQDSAEFYSPSLDVEAFFFHPMAMSIVGDLQTRCLGASLAANTFVDMETALEADQVRAQAGKYAGAEDAMARLDNLAFFGLSEQFEESLALFAYTFGRRPVRQSPRFNVTENRLTREALPAHVLARIAELNQQDLKLYEYARRRFAERYAQMIHTLLDDHYRRENPAFRQTIAACRITFDQPLPQATGWYEPERDARGQAWRWLGPDPSAVVDLPLEPARELRIQFCVRHTITPEILESLTLAVNDQPIACTQAPAEGEGIICTGVIPATVIDPTDRRAARISFHVARTLAPATLDPSSDDTRRLGVALSWVEIAPVEA